MKVLGDSSVTESAVDVLFEVPAALGARTASVVGEFNDWSADAHPMEPRDDGSFGTTIALPAGRSYQFRYLVDGERWENDWEADFYAPNNFGGDDSVVDLSAWSGSSARGEVTDELAVQSIPLDTEDGGTVVIEQQNVGAPNQVGGGEFKNVDGALSVDMRVLDAKGVELAKWTRSDPSDTIATVGGNRYGWLVYSDFETLALDNITKVLN